MPGSDRPRAKVFATMGVAAVLLAGAIAQAGWAYRGLDRYMPDLNVERPHLARAPALLGPPPPRLARRVVLVMIDGLRLDSSYGRPWLDSLRERGVDARAASTFPTFSHPNYVSILTGVGPRESGVRNNIFPWPVAVDSVMARARAARRQVAYVSPDDGGVPRLFPADLDSGAIAPWQGGFAQALQGVLASPAELVLVWITDVDGAGHAHGAASPEYREAARAVDAQLAEGFAGFDFRNDALVVVADHGHVDRGGHGGVEPEVVDVPLVLAGAGVRPGVTLVDARLVDVAPTVATLLGVPAPAHALGRTLASALSLTAAESAGIADADARRWARLQSFLFAEEQAARRLGIELAARRTAIMTLFLCCAAAAVILAARRHWIVLDRRVLLISLPAFPLTFYSMLVVFENWASASMVPARGSVAEKLVSYGALAAVVQLIATWLSLTGRPTPHARLQAAAGATATGLVVALVPVGVAWRLASSAFGQVLPEPSSLLLVPVVLAAVTCYATAAAFVLLTEWAIFLARVTGRD